ncbi:MAG: putative DNA base hypermodification protein [Candidatus Pacearchaeota archaeon]
MFNEKHLKEYLESALERHRIYKRRQAGEPKPWTNNPIFQEYFFCNVFRQYDKCSKWIIDKVVPYKRFDLIVVYRYISTMSIYNEIDKEGIKPDELDKVQDLLEEMKRREKTLFNGCFIRNTRIGGGYGEGTEAHKVPFILIELMRKANAFEEIRKYDSFENLVWYLMEFPTIKGFMGYEYACDWEYTGEFKPIDKYSWANKGPGATRGLSLVVHGNQYENFSYEKWLFYIRELFKEMKKLFNEEFPEEDFSMREVEHWLCEYQKYVKYKDNRENGTQVKHRKYNGK